MFKFELGQVVFYLENNRVHSAPIMSRVCVENLHDDWDHTVEQRSLYQKMGKSSITYVTVHGVYCQSQLFDSAIKLTERLGLTHSDKYLY